ncbi:Threonine--tRNA ligase [Candidatus Arcanobacter lacustris]|uniref:Threonine--tRNA ligase n=1 Tax=Candidatus Arcanibacter lacustris TaxID=1607817 RepID=A0A0F5MQE2_9RICK|nr:Threonine--tRNA ligase [Candidatus Arcanobacter lacustris]
MINIIFPDGNAKEFENNVTGFDIASSISISLAKIALAIEVDGELKDLNIPITKDAKIRIITPKDPEGLEIIRHDAAHIMAEAVKELYPDVQVTIGPAIENGFYYDFARNEPFTPDDLLIIEAKMREISKRDEKIVREEWDRDEAVAFFKKINEHYKAELIEAIPAGQVISLYRQGEFIDLCRGPHAPSTSKIKAFKLMKLAGAYWRGDSKNQMLQRIYGTAWADEKQLQDYLTMIEEAEKRDHRKIGKELNLFHLQEEAPGMVFWHEQGWTLYRIIEDYIRGKLQKNNYIEVKTPVLVDRSLWEKSGHWEKFREHIFTSESEEKVMALKPMNCPCHVQIFNYGLKSYRDLPLRMAEFGSCHRNESSGSLHGLLRVRGFVQDDAHIFCSEDMITSETVAFCKLLKEVYHDFGFDDFQVKFSDRPDVRAGTDETWDKAENSLKEAVIAAGHEFVLNKGEGAFYGPKLEFVLKDAIGRDWQLGTLQVDFILPERLDASYIGSDGHKHRPVMLHRAIIGTFERFIGVLIEQHAGKFPLWLSPSQFVVLTITSDGDEYAASVCKALSDVGMRGTLDISSEKVNYKIRKYSLLKVPVILVVGKQEMQDNSVSVRRLGSDEQVVISLEQLLKDLHTEAKVPC